MRKPAEGAPNEIRPVTHTSGDGSHYTLEEWLFMEAIHAYKTQSHRPYPTWAEVLAVLVSLGWRRVAEADPLPRFSERNADKRAAASARGHAEVQGQGAAVFAAAGHAKGVAK